MDNLNKHIDGLFNEKANAYKADESFSKKDFEAIRGKLPTMPNVETVPNPNANSFFKPSTLLTLAGAISIIGILFLLNRNKIEPSAKAENATQNNNVKITNNNIDTLVNNIEKDSAIKNLAIIKPFNANRFKDKIKTQQNNDTSKTIKPLAQNSIKENKIATQNFFNNLASESQFYNINSAKDTILICKNGTTLNIKANSFTTINKTEVDGIVQVEIKEAYNFTDIIANGLHTLSNSNLLESAGMVFINAKKGEQKLDINIKQAIELTMASASKKSKMQLFYLDKNANDNLILSNSNWMAKEETQNDKNTFPIRNCGWMNCGKFSNKDKEKTTIKIALQNKVDSFYTKAMLVFPKTKSLINLYYKNGFITQQNIPIGEDAYFVSFKIQNGKMLSIIQKIITQNNIIQAQEYKEIPTAEVKAMLNAIGNLQ